MSHAFELCPHCGKHGRFVFFGRHYGDQNVSKETALLQLKCILFCEYISQEDFLQLKYSLEATKLPALIDEVDPWMLWISHQFNIQCGALRMHTSMSFAHATITGTPQVVDTATLATFHACCKKELARYSAGFDIVPTGKAVQ